MNFGDEEDIQSDEESDDYDDESDESDEGNQIGGGYKGSGIFINRGYSSPQAEQKPSPGIFINRNFGQTDEIQSEEEEGETEESEYDESEESGRELNNRNLGGGMQKPKNGIFINRGYSSPLNEQKPNPGIFINRNFGQNEIEDDDDDEEEDLESEEEEEEEEEEENQVEVTRGFVPKNRSFGNQQYQNNMYEEPEEEESEEGEEEEDDDDDDNVDNSENSGLRNMREFLDENNSELLRTLLVATNPITRKAPIKRDAEGFRIPDQDTAYDPNYYNCLYEPLKRDDIKLRPKEVDEVVGKSNENKEWTKPFLEGLKKGNTPANRKRVIFKNDAGPLTPINQILKEYEQELQGIKISVAGYIAKIQEEEDAKDLKKRRHVYAEILSNEQDYVINLKLFYKVYIQPMKQFVREDLFSSMNMSVLTIIGINEPFLKEMLKCYEEGKSKGQPEPIGLEDLFSRPQTNQAFKLYFTYVLNYTDWLKEIKELLVKDEKFSKFCNGVNEKLKYSGKRKTAITTFLPQPYQHICRYKLLLNELLKRTPKTLPEHKGVKRALKKMSKITKFVNEKKKEVRTREKARQMFEKIPSLKDLVHEEIIFDADGSMGGKKGAELWLFSSCLVVVSHGKKSTRLNLKEHVSLQVNQSKEDMFVMIISSPLLHGSKKEIHFRCDSPAKCMKILGQVRSQVEKVGGHGGEVMEFRSGWLLKEEGTLLKKWKKRWVVIHSDCSIIIMKEKEGGKIKMTESLVSGKFGMKDLKKFQFYVKSKKANMVFRAENENEINAWFVALRMVKCVQEDQEK